ncbi:MAG: trp operon repressor [Treponema sp.]|nr:trp operon repressor [Treponema sp.]
MENKKDNEFTDDAFKEMCSILADCNDSDFINDFLRCLCTPAEIKDFANRWLLVKEIEKGTSQREIAKKFGMSLCKITRGSRELHKENSAFKRVLDILAEKNSGNRAEKIAEK